MEIKKGLIYTEDHEWVKVDGNVATVGLADYAQHNLGDIVYVELPEIDDEFSKGDAVASVESVKAASEVFTAASGKIVEVNEALDDEPALINEGPYDAWIFKIEMSDPSELDDLMDDEKYAEFAKED